MGRNLAKNRYELDQVYVKPTEGATSYHHPDCGHADSANYEIDKAEREGYRPALCCLSGINMNRERFVLTDRAHKEVHQRAEEQDREPGEVASTVLNQHFSADDEQSSIREVVGEVLQVIR
jgi:hypothetical protein